VIAKKPRLAWHPRYYSRASEWYKEHSRERRNKRSIRG